MKIGIIGAGQIGGALAHRLTALGHQVEISNSRGPETLRDLAAESGATAVDTGEALQGVDLAILTIPMKKVESLPEGLFARLPASVPVIDTNNYYPRERDGGIDGIEGGLMESQWVEQQIGHPVIKVFNNIQANHLREHGKPKGAPGRIALPVSGDDTAAKATVLKLVDDLGFDPVDVGGLDQSWRQQPGSPVYGTDLDAAGVRDGLAKGQKDRATKWSATANSPGSFEQPA